MIAIRRLLLPAALLPVTGAGAAPPPPPSIVLVHGMGMNASSWQPLAAILRAKGYRVAAVQAPLTGLAADVAAARRVIDAQPGPVVLVGHSYGGVVITTAGNDPKVKALVYVAAIQPDRGETMGGLNARMPSTFPKDGTVERPKGFVQATRRAFVDDVGQDLPRGVALRLAATQRPTSVGVFTAPTLDPAWRHKPSFAVVASRDRTVNPGLERWMYRRSHSRVTEVATGHMAYLAAPTRVAAVIEEAATAVR